MEKLALELNKALGPAAEFLSSRGKRMYFPYGGILGQGAEAKKCAINATIGMAFEEDGSPLVMRCFSDRISLDKRAFLYAGSFGNPELRARWKILQGQKNPSLTGVRYSMPVVTNALTHGIRIVAELFGDKTTKLVTPNLYWDNYALIFREACETPIETFNMFKDGCFDAEAMKRSLMKPGKRKILILNFPNNPTGYTATFDDAKKIVVVLDDAYFGLVYEEGIHGESLFAEFAKLDKNVLAVKLDGTTKEDYVWGLRVGFISFAFKGATAQQLKALEAKAAGNVRSAISNVTSIGQRIAASAYTDRGYVRQKREKFMVLMSRYRTIRKILLNHPEYEESFDPMPFNSGYFMCVKPKKCDAEDVRKHLIAKYSTGVIVLSGLLRLAFSTVPCAKLPELFRNVYSAIRDIQNQKKKK